MLVLVGLAAGHLGSQEYVGGSGGLMGFGHLCDATTEAEVPLTGGPHLDLVVLMCLADDVLGPDAEAVVPRVAEGVGQVVGRAGHRHRVALPFLQGEALGLEPPAHSQRGATGHRDRF